MAKFKRAFYPCCAVDFEEPMSMMENLVDEIVFNNIRFTPSMREEFNKLKDKKPKAVFLKGDVRQKIEDINNIDVLFYRRDSEGEGGSGIYVLGDSFLWKILEKFNPNGGLIITDGSNSRGGLFKKMKRNNGLRNNGWFISQSSNQYLLAAHKLYIFDVKPLNPSK